MQEKFTQVQQNYTKQSDGEVSISISFCTQGILIHRFTLYSFLLHVFFTKKRKRERLGEFSSPNKVARCKDKNSHLSSRTHKTEHCVNWRQRSLVLQTGSKRVTSASLEISQITRKFATRILRGQSIVTPGFLIVTFVTLLYRICTRRMILKIIKHSRTNTTLEQVRKTFYTFRNLKSEMVQFARSLCSAFE